MPNAALLASEDFRRDCLDSQIPDWVHDMRPCRACGGSVAKDDLDENGLCATCGPEFRRLEAIGR